MKYHVQIAKENRVSTAAKPRPLSIPVSGQLHNMGDSIKDITSAQIVYAASWDTVSPWIVILKGDNSAVTMRYAGWPTVDEATWKLNNPVTTI